MCVCMWTRLWCPWLWVQRALWLYMLLAALLMPNEICRALDTEENKTQRIGKYRLFWCYFFRPCLGLSITALACPNIQLCDCFTHIICCLFLSLSLAYFLLLVKTWTNADFKYVWRLGGTERSTIHILSVVHFQHKTNFLMSVTKKTSRA